MPKLYEQLTQLMNQKTKPLGALGLLEQLAIQVGVIQQTTSPSIQQPHIVVFAADHGIAATGLINPFPQAVTAQMVLNFANGGAAINVFCRQNNLQLTVVDAGVNTDFDPALPIIHAAIQKGTNDYRSGNALSAEAVQMAIEKGQSIVAAIAASGCNTIGFGEMGIGNTSSASLIMHHLLGLPLAACVGRGTGANDAQLEVKLSTLKSVSAFHQLDSAVYTGMEILERVGGLEIAMMTGAYLEAARQKMVMVVDGFIATSALLLARAFNPAITQNCVFAHSSNEQGHTLMLQELGAKPLLQLGLRLGEGTGAALAMPLIKSAVAILNEMASFQSAGVDGGTE